MFLGRLGVGRRPTESDGGSLDLVLGRVGPVSCISSKLLTTINIGLPLVQSCFLFFQLNLAGIFKLNYKMKDINKATLSMPGLMTPNILAAKPQSSLAAKAHGPNTSPFQFLTSALGGSSMMDSGRPQFFLGAGSAQFFPRPPS